MSTSVRTINSRARRSHSVTNPRKSLPMTLLMVIFLIYALTPIVWLLINSTKTQPDLFSTFGLAFGSRFALWDNIVATLTYDNGIFIRWLGNTFLAFEADARPHDPHHGTVIGEGPVGE
jgi:multiple sugar transport system permease protein